MLYCSSSGTAHNIIGGVTSIFSVKIGVLNIFPQSMLHLGNYEVVGPTPIIFLGKNTRGGDRNAFMGCSDTFFLYW